VGEINAPKTSAMIKGMPVIQEKPMPTTAVERAIPMVAIKKTKRHCSFKSLSLTCSAPANSKRPSMPSSSASEKSMPVTVVRTTSAIPRAGTARSTRTITNEASRETTRMPIALGSLRKK
jgi:hypothetical protein